jgi:hypothetical protein
MGLHYPMKKATAIKIPRRLSPSRVGAAISVRGYDNHGATIPITRMPETTVPITTVPSAVPVGVAVTVMMIVAPVRLSVLTER